MLPKNFERASFPSLQVTDHGGSSCSDVMPIIVGNDQPSIPLIRLALLSKSRDDCRYRLLDVELQSNRLLPASYQRGFRSFMESSLRSSLARDISARFGTTLASRTSCSVANSIGSFYSNSTIIQILLVDTACSAHLLCLHCCFFILWAVALGLATSTTML